MSANGREYHPREPQDVGAPVQVWDCPGLTLFEVCLWANIKSLSKSQRACCWASNAYLARITRNASQRHVSRALSHLEEACLIRIQTEYDPTAKGSHRRTIRCRCPWLEDPVPEGWTKMSTPPQGDQSSKGGGQECLAMAGQESLPRVDTGVHQSLRSHVVPRGTVESEKRLSKNNNNSAAPSSCALPRAVVVAPPCDSDPDPDDDSAVPVLSPAAQLLHDTGLFTRARAEQLAQGWNLEWLAAWIEESRDRPAGRRGGFLIRILERPEKLAPEGYLERQRRAAKIAVPLECACGWSGYVTIPAGREPPDRCVRCARAPQ